jgi:hypothetical protein
MKTTDPSTTNIPPAEGALTSSSVTAKGLLVGAICSGIIGAGVVYADNTIRGSYLALDFASPTALVTLFFLALLLNPILSRLRRTWALSTADVAVVYIMALMAASLPSMGLTGFLLSYLTGAQYYSTAENEWAELFLRHVPEHLLVLDPEAVQHFYEGNPVGAGGIPWNAWIVPLLAWGIFLGVLYLVMIAVMVILRRQWMDHERLLYPLMQPSLMLIERPESARAAAHIPCLAVLGRRRRAHTDRRRERPTRLLRVHSQDHVGGTAAAVPQHNHPEADAEFCDPRFYLLPQPGYLARNLGFQPAR